MGCDACGNFASRGWFLRALRPIQITNICSCRPLVVIGKGAAYSQADAALRQLVDQAQLPFLATAMGRGVVPDTHPASANAARSLALAQADVAIVFGARWGPACP